MKVSIIGTGYVGLVTGAGLASAGNDVICMDSDRNKILTLQGGNVPFHEPGLAEQVRTATAGGRLHFTTEMEPACTGADIVMVAVGTPSNGHGEADLTALAECVSLLLDNLRHHCLVVLRSTVPPGTCETIQQRFDRMHPMGRSPVRVASNPEFLAEGTAVKDFRHPERIVIGVADEVARDTLCRLYAPFDPDGHRRLVLDVRTAEFAKYACNAMLAARVSMVNELADIAAACDADITDVFRVVGSDPRIGHRYLHPGPGFGGSCLPKDVRALQGIAALYGVASPMLRCVEHANARRVDVLADTVTTHFGTNLDGRCIAVWGLAFKPGTDDIRESPALRLVDRLLEAGARIQACDPVVRNFPQRAHPRLSFRRDPYATCQGAELLCVMTGWPEFCEPDWKDVATRMGVAVVLDPHRLFDAATLRNMGLSYLESANRSVEWTYSGMPFFDLKSPRSNSSSVAP